MGIELKGWFILAKEGEPSFRYTASPNVCQPQDLMVVYPWGLDEVISGAPRLMRPFIEEARYAAEHRNHYWENRRYRGNPVTGDNSKVRLSPVARPYPRKNQQFNDKPVADVGGNFGRFARGGLMAAFIEELLSEPISGIPANYWQRFLKIFAEGVDSEKIERKLQAMRTEAEKGNVSPSGLEALDRIHDGLRELLGEI